MYNISQINNALKSYVDNEMVPNLPQIMKIFVGTYVDSMQLTKEQMDKLIDNPIIKPLNIYHDGNYDLDKLLENLESNVKKYGPIEFKISKIGLIPLKNESIFRFNNDDINKFRNYLKQQ